MSEISSIDDLLLTGSSSSQQPKAAEHIPEEAPDSEDVYEIEQDTTAQEPEETSEPEEIKQAQDDYGNEVEKPRTYTEEEHRELVNRAVRDRMARLERNNPQITPQQPQQQAAQDFQYNPESSDNWETQLESFVERTFDKISQKQATKQQQAREQQINAEFETKLHQGMSKFKDFVEVVGKQPIDDAMTLATRGMNDPAAFLYAASKKAPEELVRIAQIQDPYTKMREIGNLEERLRKNKNTTNAPKPIGMTKSDSSISTKSVKKEQSIEEQIRLDADRKRKIMNERRRVR